jgi:hypothetical protein
LDELELAYPSDDVPDCSSNYATHHVTASPTDISPETVPFYQKDSHPDAAAFVPRPSHSRRRKEGHIPRPPNAFMLFRSELWSHGRIEERDHRQISRIAGSMWNRMVEAQKQPFKERAALVKKQHEALYPNYKYSPVYKTHGVRRRTKKIASEGGSHVSQGQNSSEYATRSRRTLHNDSSSYTPSSRRRGNSSRCSKKSSRNLRADMHRSPTLELASPEAKMEILTTPQLAYPSLASPHDPPTRSEEAMITNVVEPTDQVLLSLDMSRQADLTYLCIGHPF